MILAITYRAVTELKPYPRNARTHSRKQVKQIAAAIREFGFTNPVLIDEHDQIIAGHGRVAAARGSLRTFCRCRHCSSATSKPNPKASLHSGRQPACPEAGWDKEILSVELQRLLDDGFEVILTGFEVPDVDVVLDAAAEAKSDRLGDDLIPDPGSAVSARVTSGDWGLTDSSVAVRSTLAPTSVARGRQGSLRRCRRRRQAEYHCGDPEFIRHHCLRGTHRVPAQTGAAYAYD